VSSIATIVALPVTAVAVWLMLRSPLSGRLRRAPETTRWRTSRTPLVGGVGIFLGFSAGLWLAVLTGALDGSTQLAGLYGGAALLFAAGLADDLFSLPPVVKLAAQGGAAAIALSTGTSVEIVGNRWLAIPLGVVWLIGMTNALNLLDNMDGLAGSLAVISAGFFACSAAIQGGATLVLVTSLALALAILGFLPFNLRPHRAALTWMGDSGSQTIGFTLAGLGLASSYTVASSTVATLVLPVLVLAVPILDTALVTIVRLLDGRPVSQGGRDHSSHRLVSLGLSETGAVVLLALVSAALGATSLAYEAFGNGRIAAIGVLLSFALLVQFGSFLADVDRGRSGKVMVYVHRVAEVCIDGALIAASFLAAYLLRFDGIGTPNQRHMFLLALPVLLLCRYTALLLLGMYASVWRYASARDAFRVAAACAVSAVCALGLTVLAQGPIGDFSSDVFVIDALICTVALTGARLGERVILQIVALGRRDQGRRILIVGAGRAGRSLLRELRETPGQHVVGFVDDDAALRGRRLNGVRILSGTGSLEAALERVKPDVVLVTIPDAPTERLEAVVRTCARHEIECRFVKRDIDVLPQTILSKRT
jgi:UDP-GlcNAc:undecaprenyl-phosphate/decaprenyl-phosphate GlcNAc-1-phosphate transferase